MDKYQQFIRGKFTEEELESAIIELFHDEGWSYINGESLHRRYEDVLMEDVLADSLRRRYSDLALTDGEVCTLVNELKYVPSAPLYDGNRRTFWLINEGIDLLREDASLPSPTSSMWTSTTYPPTICLW